MRLLASLACLWLAAIGGVVAYRAAFIAPRTSVIIDATGVRERPDIWRIILGLTLLVTCACLAYLAVRPHRRP
jgi:hypothetical protein